MKKLFLFVTILLLICNVVVANETVDPLWIGIVRADGILVPIGTYHNDKWVNTWPEACIDEQPEVERLVKAINGKMQLQDIPALWKGTIKAIPTKLYLWSEELPLKNLKVLNAELYWSHCSSGWALKTNLQPIKEEKGSPTTKVGIATNFKANVIPFKTIDNDSRISLALVQAIKAKFDEKERVSPDVSLKDREKGSIELTRIYETRYEINGRSLYFIEAQRKYTKPNNAPDADCYNLNSLNSWVMMQGNNISLLSTEFVASDCDGKEINTIIPDVVITRQGRYYTVTENYGYEWETYRIHEIVDESMKEVLRVDGGGC